VAIAVSVLLNDRGVHCQALQETDAVEKTIERFEPDVVVLDYRLRGTDGRQVHGRIRSRWPKLPVIMMSAELPDIADLLHDGATMFLAKPFDGDELLKVIHQVVDAE
jgi:DNA-binding response OmpR family regulator